MEDERIIEEKIISTVIDKLVSILGKSGFEALNFHLRRVNSNVERIYKEPEKVKEGLRVIFKDGSVILEGEIVKSICNAFGINSSFNDDIITIIRKIKEGVNKLLA